ncbi:MAG: hypothetical protein WAO98_00415 [Alphaproteobacteria bacterium]
MLLRLLLLSFLMTLPAASTLQAAEKLTAGGACTSDTNVLDWDTVWQCVSNVWVRAGLFIGTSSDTCDSTKAGKMRYNSPNMEYCNGTAWTVLTDATVSPGLNAPAGTGYFVMSKSTFNGCLAQNITTITHSGTTATVTTAAVHMLSVGMRVVMAGIVVGGTSSAIYNGTFTIATVPTSTSFTYTMGSDPGADPDAGAAGASLVSLTFSTTTVTATTGTAHNLAAGQYIKLIDNQPIAYNGTYVVATVPTSTTFTYTLRSTPAANTAVGSYSTFIGKYCLSNSTYTRDQVCLNELTTNTDWMGYSTANANGKLTQNNVFNFICCRGMPPYATFSFARAGASSIGGATFKGDVDGLGPNDSANWGASNYFGTAQGFWSERYLNSSTQWRTSARSSGEDCNNWSDSTAFRSGVAGNPNNVDATRWYGGTPGNNFTYSCDRLNRIVCWVNP